MNHLKAKIASLKREYENTCKELDSERNRLEEAKMSLSDVLEAQGLAQEAAEQIQQQVHKRITTIVNKCLQTIFDDPYEFQIRFQSKRGKTEAELVFIRDGRERKNVGGGVIDVVAFALRLSSLLLSNKGITPIEILDQPFGNVSKANGYLERVPEMLEMLSKEFSIQFIQVTHSEELKIGKVVELKGGEDETIY